jgi:type I restriction enzyme S subunit
VDNALAAADEFRFALRRFKPYPAYRASGVDWLGKVPAHWEIKRLKNLAGLRAGAAITSDRIEPDGDYPVFGGNGLRGYTSSYTHEGEFPLVGRQGALCGCVAFASGKFWASEHAIIVAPKTTVGPNWLARLLEAMSLNAYSQSAAQPGLAVETIGIIHGPAPSIEEQRAIAAFLDREMARIDALVAKKEQLIALLQEKRIALITRAVTKGLDPNAPMRDSGVEWLGEIPAHWGATKLRYGCSLLRDGTHQPPERVAEGYPLLSVRNIVDGKLARLPDDSMISEREFRVLERSFEIRENDILLAIVGATLGKVAVVPPSDPFAVQRSLAVLRPRQQLLDFQYLASLFQSHPFQRLLWQSVGYSAQPGIYLNGLASFRVSVPPIREQAEIVEFVLQVDSVIDELIGRIRVAIERLKELRTALISAAVTGKIDVREEAG